MSHSHQQGSSSSSSHPIRTRSSDSHDENPTTPPPTAAAAASSSSGYTRIPSTGSATRSRVASSNPLENLLKDLKCCICLSIARSPISLPCNHFFCHTCLHELMDAEAEKERETRKAKSNASLRLPLACPECRHEYNRRTIVQDPVVRNLAKLCAQLQMQPDVNELKATDDSIFDMSQVSPQSSPRHRRLTRAASDTSPQQARLPHIDPFQRQRSSTPTARRKLETTPSAAAAAPSPSSSSTKREPAAYDPFAFDQLAPQLPITRTPVYTSKRTPLAVAASSSASSSNKKITTKLEPTDVEMTPRTSGRVPRKAALARKSYKELETQVESFSPEGGESSQEEEEVAEDDTDESEGQSAAASRTHTPTAAAASSSSDMTPYKHRKNYPYVPIPPDGCAVCGEVTDEEAVVKCLGCGICVHAQLCYGSPTHTLTNTERETWHCDRCSITMGTKKVTCCVCPNTDDQAFKRTDKGQWIHASCAQWLSGPRWKNPATRNIVCDVKRILPEWFTVGCKFCTGKGAIIQCSYGHNSQAKCAFGYHIPCGVRHGILFEMRGPDESSQMSQEEECDDVFFHSFCKTHQPLKDTVPNCNSRLALSAKKEKKKRTSKKQQAAAASSSSEKATPASNKRTRGSAKSTDREEDEEDQESRDSKRVKREKSTLAVASSRSLDPLGDDVPVPMEDVPTITPIKTTASDNDLFQSLFNGPSNSPFTTPIATRKLTFSPFAPTTSVGVTTRISPLKGEGLPPMVRSASAGAMSSQSTRSPLKPQLASRPSSLQPINFTAAAAASSSTPHVTRSMAHAAADVTSTPAAAAGVPPSSTRAPLRSMARDEVQTRDSQARNTSLAAPSTALKSRALARRHIVMLGTKLDEDQQKLLEELAEVLNKSASASAAGKHPGAGEKFVYVKNVFDDTVTHVITSASSDQGYILQNRTLKYLQGLVSGAYVLGVDWVGASLCSQKMMPEMDYLVRGDSKLNSGERTDSAKRARNTREKLFAGIHFVWSGSVAKPGIKEDASSLIQLGGGTLVEAFPGVSSRKATPSEDSDMDEGESQTDDVPSQSSSSSPHKRTSSSHLLSGRWLLLVDDSGVKRKASSKQATLQKFVTPIDWQYCVQNHIEVVSVNWLFDSISGFKLLPTEKPTKL